MRTRFVAALAQLRKAFSSSAKSYVSVAIALTLIAILSYAVISYGVSKPKANIISRAGVSYSLSPNTHISISGVVRVVLYDTKWNKICDLHTNEFALTPIDSVKVLILPIDTVAWIRPDRQLIPAYH